MSAGFGGRGARSLRILQRSDTERQRKYRHTELEALADGKSRRRAVADGGRHPGRIDVGGDAENSGVQVQTAASQSGRWS